MGNTQCTNPSEGICHGGVEGPTELTPEEKAVQADIQAMANRPSTFSRLPLLTVLTFDWKL